MSHLNKDFLLDLSDNFFLLYDRNLDNFLLYNFIGNKFLDDFSDIDFTFLCVCNESGNLAVKINCLFVSDYEWYLSLDFNVSVALEYLLVNNLNLANLISCLSQIHRFLNNFLDFNVFFLPWNLDWLLYFNDFASFHNNLFVILYFNNLLFIQWNNFLNLNIV